MVIELHQGGFLSTVWIFKGIVVVNFLVRVIIFCFLPGLLPLTKIVVWIVENTAVTGRIKAVCVGLMRLTEK